MHYRLRRTGNRLSRVSGSIRERRPESTGSAGTRSRRSRASSPVDRRAGTIENCLQAGACEEIFEPSGRADPKVVCRADPGSR
jgi:hypothetical protein